MGYLCRPNHIAVVIFLQSQLHSVNGRDAFGDLTMRPSSSTLEDLGLKAVPARSKACGCGDSTTLKHTLIRVKQELRTQPSRTSADTTGESHRVQERIPSLRPSFRQIHACQFPIGSHREPSERIREGLVATVPFSLGARLENLDPISA